jgi:indolepyruvate ferredoxin oxidoreductase
VVTVGALVTMAAHLEGKQASVLDFMGFAQKGGAVLSFVRIAPTADLLNQVRIDTQQADLVLACDLVVGASADALGTVKHGRTVIHVNTHEIATAAFVHNPDASLHADALIEKMRFAAGDDRVERVDAQAIAEHLLGDTMPSNIIMLGYAFQRGLVPVSEVALLRAIELNNVAVEMNRTAFALGRIAAAAPQELRRFAGLSTDARALSTPKPRPDWEDLDGVTGLIERRAKFLTEYQSAAYALRYRALVERVRAGESARIGAPLRLTAAVARYAAKLMAIKDEYEVARLYTDGRYLQELSAQFERWSHVTFHMAPPLLARSGADGRPRKIELGPWLLRLLALIAPLKRLRGTALDIFGRTAERRLERQLRDDYEALIDEVLANLKPANYDVGIQIATVPEQIRGYGHVKLANITLARARWKDLLDRFHGRTPSEPSAQPQPVVMQLKRERVG